QRQRIGVARAMVMEPELVVADEPISALDVSIRAQVLNLLKKFQQERQTTYLFIAHDLSIVRFISDRIGVIYKGDIVEVADAEELFDYPLHPYTRSLISAIPIPDPELEKRKKLFAYDPSVHDYSECKPSLQDIGHGHYVFGSDSEIAEYKRIRESGTPLKSITILTDEEMAAEAQAHKDEETDETSILDTPIHDTGNILYTIGSFIPVVGTIAGFIAGAIFKKHNYIRNYKACKRGAIAGLCTFGAIIGLFGLALLSSLL
ncbi:MAG: ABC transporter ATP-binding protein, partial [Clostridia bacterium]|nr:ABC transporter ATP-binding protein [Clostridia bacterium]